MVLCGLKIGGVETYIVRLSKALQELNIEPVVLILTRKNEPSLLATLEKHASVIWIDEVQQFRGYTSWLNAFIPLKTALPEVLSGHFDYVHVVDSLTLHFLALNRHRLSFDRVSIGLYHEQEFQWWRERNVRFRSEQIALARLNMTSIFFPNEINREDFARQEGVSPDELPLLPLGIEIPEGDILANKKSLKLISIGRLVDFKTYNKLVITILPELRKFGNFTYEIYGTGPMQEALRAHAVACGVQDHVIFHGNIAPELLPQAFQDAFCFIGSGTTIITAASYGVPSIVGMESNLDLTSGGLFCNVIGYSYNEAESHKEKKPMLETLIDLHEQDDREYAATCRKHVNKASQFNIKNTAVKFIAYGGNALKVPPKLSSRFKNAVSVISSLVPLFGPGLIAFKERYYKK